MTTPPGSCMIVLEGEWDLARRDDLAGRVERALATCEPGAAVVVDLRRTTFIDSSALSVLVNLHNRLRTDDRRLITLCSSASAARRTIELLGLGDQLGMLESEAPAGEDDAVA